MTLLCSRRDDRHSLAALKDAHEHAFPVSLRCDKQCYSLAALSNGKGHGISGQRQRLLVHAERNSLTVAVRMGLMSLCFFFNVLCMFFLNFILNMLNIILIFYGFFENEQFYVVVCMGLMSLCIFSMFWTWFF